MSGITGQPVPSLGPPQHFHTRLVKCTTLRTKEEEKAATPPNLFFRFLSDISELVAPPLVPKGQPKVKVFIHLVRHAQVSVLPAICLLKLTQSRQNIMSKV